MAQPIKRGGSRPSGKRPSRASATPRIKKDDQVVVISGREKGKVGRVLRVDTRAQRVVVEGLNLVKKARRPNQQQQQGGISEIEAAIHVSNVMLSTNEGRSRVRFATDGPQKRRVAVRTGEDL